MTPTIRQTGTVRLPLRILVCLAGIVLLVSACSSSAVVASEERTAGLANGDSDETTAQTGEDASGNGDDADDSDGGDNDQGSGEEPLSARDFQASPGFSLGTAEQLGALSTDCIAGNNMACDILFPLSDFDSDEEATALTCGGRSDVEVIFCTEGITAGLQGLVLSESSPGLPEIVTACRDGGDMTACDFLYLRSPLESDTEAIGATCGERVEVAVPDCRTFLTDDEIEAEE